MTWTLIIIPLMGWLNRVRGGGLGGQYIPFKALYAVTPIVGLLALLAGHPVYVSLSFAIAYLIWALPAWGRWFDLGNLPDDYGREPGKYSGFLERWIDEATTDDLQAMLVRHGLMLTLGITFVAAVAYNPFYLLFIIIMPWLILNAYIAGWKYSPSNPIGPAEVLTGLSWGLFIWLTSLLP
jgi:hypothetical protein